MEVTNLSSFRHQLSAAFSKNNWSVVSRFLSPEFSFQGVNSGGNRMLMPDSEIDLAYTLQSQGPLVTVITASGRDSLLRCGFYTHSTSKWVSTAVGGSFILVGIDRWQGFWLVFWAFQDPNGGGDACATS